MAIHRGGLLYALNEQLLEKIQAQDAAENRDADPQSDNASQDDAPMQEDAAPLEDTAPLDDAAPPDDASATAPSSTAILSTCDNAPQDDGSAAGTSRTAILCTCSEAVDNTLMTEDPLLRGCTLLTEDTRHSASHTNGPGLTSLIKMPDGLAPQRPRLYYGWICSDDKEDPAVMASSPLSELVKLLVRPDKKRKRKSRWDM